MLSLIFVHENHLRYSLRKYPNDTHYPALTLARVGPHKRRWHVYLMECHLAPNACSSFHWAEREFFTSFTRHTMEQWRRHRVYHTGPICATRTRNKNVCTCTRIPEAGASKVYVPDGSRAKCLRARAFVPSIARRRRLVKCALGARKHQLLNEYVTVGI